jgi:hypothetical protein
VFSHEQVKGRDLSRAKVGEADSVIIGVRDVDPVLDCTEPSGLGELGMGPVPVPGLTGAEERLDCPHGGVEDLDFVVVGIGHVHTALGTGNPEGMLESNFLSDPVLVPKDKESLADQGA